MKKLLEALVAIVLLPTGCIGVLSFLAAGTLAGPALLGMITTAALLEVAAFVTAAGGCIGAVLAIGYIIEEVN